MKWWRWYPQVGRWMPSEPPQGLVDAAHWCVSDAPPLDSGPRVDADNRREPTPVRQSVAPPPPSSSLPSDPGAAALGHLRLLQHPGAPT